ncbi:MAG TPA: ABC transporter substrate-binding protein, partial [Acidimicrobiia bacterium]|nr:ABC transporter substrate-binding protein [Acidimicrobiia bacterium]
DRDRAAAKVLGYTEAYYDEAPIIIDNYRPYAQNLQSKGVQVFEYVNEPANLAALYKSLADVGYTPKYGLFNGNMYDQKLVQNGGAALKGTILISTAIVPFELASSHPATKEYIDILAKYANGAQPKSLGINGWSAWLLWAKSVKACGNDVTRDCVLKHAAATTDWTAGGVHAPTKPGNGTSPGNQCFVLIRATPTGFQVDKQITKPNNGIFNCDPANAFDLPGFAKS